MKKSAWVLDSEKRTARSEKALLTQVRQLYSTNHDAIPDALMLQIVDLLTADEIMAKAKAEKKS